MAAVACPHCRGLMQYVPEFSGQVVACAHCGKHMRMAISEGAEGLPPAASSSPLPPQKPAAQRWQSGPPSYPPPSAPLGPNGGAEIGASPFAGQQPHPLIAKGSGFRPTALGPAQSLEPQPTSEEAPPAPARRREKSMALEMVKIVLGGIAGLALGCLVISYFMPGFFGGPKKKSPVTAAPMAPVVSTPRVEDDDAPPVEWKNQPAVTSARAARSADQNRRPGESANRQISSVSPSTPGTAVNSIRVIPGQVGSANSATPSSRSVPLPRAKSDPLTILPASLALPLLATTGPHPLGRLAEGHDPIELHLKSSAADLAPDSAFFTEPADSSKTVWNAYFSASLATVNANKFLMGAFTVGPSELGFRWHEPLPDAVLRQQFENCLLEAKTGNFSRVVSLRTPQREAPLRLDLNKAKDLHEYSVTNLPREGEVLLEVSECRNFPSDVGFKDGVKQAPLGKQLTLEFKNMPGAEINVKFSKLTDGKLTVLVAPVFREGTRSVFELTYEQLETTRLSVERLLSKSQQDLAEAQQRYRAAQGALSSLNLQLGSANLTQRNAIQQQIAAVSGQLKRAASRVSSLQKQLPGLQERSQAVPKVKQLLDALHQRAELRLQIFVPCGEHRIVLVEASQIAPQGAE